VIPKFVARAMAGRPLIVFGDGLQTRDYTWVGDSARGIRMAAESDALLGDCVNIAHGREVSVLEVAGLVQGLLGTTVPIEHRANRPGDVRRHLAGVGRASSILGFTASVDLEQGLERYVAWLRTQPGDPEVWLRGEEVVNWQSVMQPA
jgi:UDP-glucose 4-epimerase